MTLCGILLAACEVGANYALYVTEGGKTELFARDCVLMQRPSVSGREGDAGTPPKGEDGLSTSIRSDGHTIRYQYRYDGELVLDEVLDFGHFAGDEVLRVPFEVAPGIEYEAVYWGSENCEGDSEVPPPSDSA